MPKQAVQDLAFVRRKVFPDETRGDGVRNAFEQYVRAFLRAFVGKAIQSPKVIYFHSLLLCTFRQFLPELLHLVYL